MTQQHPITPPPSELVLQWIGEHFDCTAGGELSDLEHFLTIRAAQWGADQELEACCEEMKSLPSPLGIPFGEMASNALRNARRTKPPSLKEQALGALYAIATGADDTREFHQDLETIKQALESLPD